MFSYYHRETFVNTRIRAYICINFLFFYLGLVLFGQVEKPNDSSTKAGIEAVFLEVVVADPMNRYITGLEKKHFKIFEDSKEQEILQLDQKALPASIGLIFDISQSMKEKVDFGNAINAIIHTLESPDTHCEYFLITFNQTVMLVKDFSQHGPTLPKTIVFQKPGGNSALWDAVYLGLGHIMNGAHDSKALVLITDGEDNSSKHSASEVRELAERSAVKIYRIGMLNNKEQSAIRKIARSTGGREFFPSNLNYLDNYIALILDGLRNQYILEYKPTNQVHDGKWRRIEVKLEAPQKFPKLKVHAREGYYAPSN